jgi:type IV pilus assembly protein PilV
MRTQQSGFTMIEILVTIGILVVGLLGLAALQTLTTVAELEAYQRSQAVVLVRDLADRMTGNKLQLNSYVGNDYGLTYTACAGKVGYDLDLCEWGNQLNGASEVTGGGKNVGTMIGARGCVVKMDAQTYLVTVAWQGLSAGGIPKETCGQGAFGDDRQRRTVSTVVRIALLAAP